MDLQHESTHFGGIPPLTVTAGAYVYICGFCDAMDEMVSTGCQAKPSHNHSEHESKQLH